MYNIRQLLNKVAILIGFVFGGLVFFQFIKNKKNIDYDFIERALEIAKVPAVGIAVIDHGKVISARSFGYLSCTHQYKVDENTLFQAGSLSKSVAAAVILKLVDEGRVSLDQDVDDLLKGWKVGALGRFSGHAVTLRQLLSMTSGLDTGGYYGYAPEEKLPTLLQILEGQVPSNNRPLQLVRKPGTKYDYSGGGYEVIELLINSITNSTLPEVAQNKLFIPLSMEQSHFSQPLPEELRNRAAQATGSDGKALSFPWRVNPELAAAGLWSTPRDLAKFVLAMIKAYQGDSHGIISTNMARQALKQQSATQYGLGFAISGSGKQLQFMKLGQNVGYQSWLIGYPETGQGAVVMTNSDNGRELAQKIIFALAEAYQWPNKGELKDAWMLNTKTESGKNGIDIH